MAQPRGNKVWGLLAFLALTGTAQSRHLLAGVMFPDAGDPLGALRWNVSQLRQLLGAESSVEGDPIRLQLPAGMMLDTNVLLNGTWMEAVGLPGLGRDLLEGLHYDSAPSFELWLINERARLGAASEAILHEATLANLAQRNHGDALGYATRLVSLNRYDENSHVLLARALRSSGDVDGAERQVDVAVRLFREELGVEPSASFRVAALSDSEARIPHPSASTVAAQLEAGEAAIAAGAWQPGLEALRGAAVASLAIDDDLLRVRAHLGLGSALVHAARGLDEEGATNLHRAASLANERGHRTHAAQARRELAWVELLRGRYERARAWLEEAAPLAEKDDAEYAWIAAVRGACESDVANYPAARSLLETGIVRAEKSGAEAPGAFAHNFLGRLHLLQGNLDHARIHVKRSLELARDASWTAFVPFPMSLLAEVHLLSGEIDTAGDTFEHAFAMSCQLGDPCWESLGARGLGLVAAARSDPASAMLRLHEAPRLCRRFPDSYLWVEAYALEALCRVAVDNDAPGASAMIGELESMAARTGMRELLARALLHRVALGEWQALDVAHSLIVLIDNPALHARLELARA
jgi:DNA-binding SARP family transcriptional activator